MHVLLKIKVIEHNNCLRSKLLSVRSKLAGERQEDADQYKLRLWRGELPLNQRAESSDGGGVSRYRHEYCARPVPSACHFLSDIPRNLHSSLYE